MYLPVTTQPDCASAWFEALRLVDARPGHSAHNVIIDVLDPTAGSTLGNPIVARVNDFLLARGKSVECVSNTIFPLSLYRRYGYPKFIDVFHGRILPRVRTNSRWSGYYFERMTRMSDGQETIDQLSRMIKRMQNPSNQSLNKHEVLVFDPSRDVTDSPYGGQCLSFLSFHLVPGSPKTLLLTAQYRNHYYIEKLLGNLIGLGRLMSFVASEAGAKVGELTVISTNAEVDQPKAKREDIVALIKECEEVALATKSAA